MCVSSANSRRSFLVPLLYVMIYAAAAAGPGITLLVVPDAEALNCTSLLISDMHNHSAAQRSSLQLRNE